LAGGRGRADDERHAVEPWRASLSGSACTTASRAIWLRAVLHLLALVFGLLAGHLSKASTEWFSPFWWYLNEPTGWLVFGLVAAGIEQIPWLTLAGAMFVTVSVLYAIVGVRVWRGGRAACRLATALMTLSAVPSIFMTYWSVDMVARGDGSVAPFGHSPIGDQLSAPILVLWPLVLLASAASVVVLVNGSSVREYQTASEHAAAEA
jgi:hypothetical protein